LAVHIKQFFGHLRVSPKSSGSQEGRFANQSVSPRSDFLAELWLPNMMEPTGS